MGAHTSVPLRGAAVKCLVDLQLRLQGLEELLLLLALLLQEGQLPLQPAGEATPGPELPASLCLGLR